MCESLIKFIYIRGLKGARCLYSSLRNDNSECQLVNLNILHLYFCVSGMYVLNALAELQYINTS